MKKLGIALLAVAAIALLAAPFATGMLTQSRLEERIAAIDASPTLTGTVTSYERGWFASRAVIEIGVSSDYLQQFEELRDIDLSLLDTSLPLIIDIYHGPVSLIDGLHLGMTRVVARIDPQSPVAQFATAELGMPYPFEFRGHAGFGNRFDFDADVPAIDYGGVIGDIGFSGLTVTGSGVGRVLSVNGATDGASYQNPFAAATLGPVRFAGQYEFITDNLPLSNVSLEIERFVASSPMLGGAPLFEANGLSASGQVTRDPSGERLAIAARYAATAITAGEGFAVNDAELGLSVSDIDAVAASEYYAIIQGATAPGGGDPAAVLEQLGPVLERLAAAGPSATFDPIRFTMPEGRFEGAITAAIDTSGLPPGQPIDLRNLAVLFGALSVAADATLAKRLAERIAVAAMQAQLATAGDLGGEDPTPEELQAMAEAQAGFVLVGLVGQGLLQDAGEDYTTSIEFRNGALTVNGAPMPLGLP